MRSSWKIERCRDVDLSRPNVGSISSPPNMDSISFSVLFCFHFKLKMAEQKKSAPIGADLLDTNKDIDSKKYQFFRYQRYTLIQYVVSPGKFFFYSTRNSSPTRTSPSAMTIAVHPAFFCIARIAPGPKFSSMRWQGVQ